MRKRKRLLFALAVSASAVCAGLVAIAAASSRAQVRSDVAATTAATRIAALVRSSSNELPSARVLREASDFDATWHRVPAIESSLGVTEFDIGMAAGGRICVAMIDASSVQAGSYGCWSKLNPGGDLQTAVVESAGQPQRVIGIAPDSVKSVEIHTNNGTFAATVADDIVSWVAPASSPGATATGSTVRLTNGAQLTTDQRMSVQ